MQDPYIVSPERVQYGSDVHMTCYILSVAKYIKYISFTWSENGKRLIHGGRYEIRSGSGTFANSVYKYYTNTLTVRDTRKSDEGKRYMCQVEVGVGAGSASYNTEEYLLGTKLSPSTTTTAAEGEDVTIFPTWSVTDVVMGFWSPGGILLATIQSISVYIWPDSRSKIKVSGLITSPYKKTVKFVICNATHEDAGRYFLTEIKRRVKHGAYSLVIAAPMSTKVASNMVPSTEVQTTFETAGVASTSSPYTHGKPAKPTISVIDNTNKIVLTCETNSSSATKDHNLSMIYTWLRNGQAVENGGRYHFSGQTLAVTDVRQEDLGNYSCQATEEGGLASDWSDTVAPEMLPKPEVQELTVNGTAHTTVKDSQVVVFRCTVDGYSSQVVYLIQESSLATVNMSRKQQNVYEHAMVVRTCSQLGVYFCSTTSVAGTVEEKQHAVVLNGMPQQQASNVFVTYGKPPSVTIRLTLCSYPGPSKTKWRFTQSGNLRDITDMTKYHLAAKNKKHNVFDYSLVINSISDVDFGAYIFSVEYNETTFDFFIPASKPLEASLPLVVGCSVGAVIITIVVTAGVILSRLKQFRDYWNLKLRRSHITPMQNMSENIEYRGYAEIDDAGISEHDTDNTMQPVVTIPGDDNIPSASGSRNEREIETIELSSGRVDEDEDGEYEEVRPLQTTSCEAQDEQETSAQVQQHDNIEEVVKSEMIMSVPGSSPHSTSSSDVTDVSADGKASGDMAVGIITVFAETSFITHEANETLNAPVINVGMEQLPATMEMSSDMKMEANTTVADETLIEGREDDADIAPGGLTDNRYDSLMPHPPLDSYTALETVDDIMYD
ncbi:uncharacterized protein LOC124122912 isoform X2 [Haliotis rufescens]|uniref:uncharacterized protein LOC124122912 isoform X2 n=1 Tax=Haliotis rufescens TaxID=6454 RepID=UPI00201F9C1C|nr:uncharacterized protein LOC124122912 isoform X2 [Haliotis rufescens]